MQIKIIVPTSKRSDILTTNIYNQILCINENEKEDYIKYDCEKIYHNLNKLSEIRQFIYNEFKDVFMVDDDIVSVERLDTNKDVKLNSKEIFDLIQNSYYIAQDLKANLFGFNNTLNPKHYKPQKPLSANNYINASAFGLLQNKNLYFNKNTVACESHWINLLNAYNNRYSFCDTRFVFRQKPNSTFLLKGGQTSKRNLITEKNDTIILKKYFGDSVKLKKGQKDAKLHHKYQRKLNIKL